MRIDFGWAAPSLRTQLKHSGLSSSDLGHFDMDADSIVRLAARGLLSDRERDRAFDRLTKRIDAEIRRAKKETTNGD